MIAKADLTPLWHAVLGVVMQTAVAFLVTAVCYLMLGRWSVTFGLVLGAIFATGFYYGREVTQRQTVLARSGGLAVVAVWHLGWAPWRWHRASQADFLAPFVVTHVLAIASGWLG